MYFYLFGAGEKAGGVRGGGRRGWSVLIASRGKGGGYPNRRHGGGWRRGDVCREGRGLNLYFQGPKFPLTVTAPRKMGKVQMGALKWGLKATLCTSCAAAWDCAHFWGLL